MKIQESFNNNHINLMFQQGKINKMKEQMEKERRLKKDKDGQLNQKVKYLDKFLNIYIYNFIFNKK